MIQPGTLYKIRDGCYHWDGAEKVIIKRLEPLHDTFIVRCYTIDGHTFGLMYDTFIDLYEQILSELPRG